MDVIVINVVQLNYIINTVFLFLQASINDVTPPIDEKFKYDNKMAKERNFQLRVSHVFEYNCW